MHYFDLCASLPFFFNMFYEWALDNVLYYFCIKCLSEPYKVPWNKPKYIVIVIFRYFGVVGVVVAVKNAFPCVSASIKCSVFVGLLC